MLKSHSFGRWMAILAAVLFGMSSPLAKIFLVELSPWFLAGLFYLGSGIGMGVLLVFQKKKVVFEKSELPWLLGIVLCGGIGGPVLLMHGLSLASASNASLLLNLESVLTAVLAGLVFGEKFGSKVILGMIFVVLGGVALIGPVSLSGMNWTGELLVGTACFAWALDNNLTRKVSMQDPVVLTFVKSSVAGVCNLVLASLMGSVWPGAEVLMWGMLLGFLCYGLSIVAFILALRHIGAARTGVYFACAPFVGALVAIVLFHEPVTIPLLVSAVLMFAGLAIQWSENPQHADPS